MMKSKKIKIFLIALLACVGLVLATNNINNSVQAATPYSQHGRLRVKGTNLVDKRGKKFQLRGVSTHGINWDVGYPYVNKAAFKTIRDKWGVNAVRLAIYPDQYNGYCTGGNQAQLRSLVYKGVSAATSLGMYVVIDWHVLNQNPNNYKSQAKKFFTTMAKKYKNNNHVIYEICNEPNNCSWSSIKSYSKTIIKTIRKYNKNAIIIVGTPTWSQLGSTGTSNEVANSPIKGYKNLMYALHFYAGEASHNQYLPAKLVYARKKKLPVIVSEFGLSPASGNGAINTTQANKWMKLLNKYDISYFCWSLSNKNESSALLNSSTKKTSNWTTKDLSKAGKYIRKTYLARKKALGKNV